MSRINKMLEYLKELRLEAKADNLKHNNALEGFGVKQGDIKHTERQVAKDMNSQMRLGEEGNMQINANDVAVPDSVRQNELRKAGLETNVETSGLDNTNTTRIANDKAEWAAEQAAYDAERKAARLAGIKERWLDRMAKDKEDALKRKVEAEDEAAAQALRSRVTKVNSAEGVDYDALEKIAKENNQVKGTLLKRIETRIMKGGQEFGDSLMSWEEAVAVFMNKSDAEKAHFIKLTKAQINNRKKGSKKKSKKVNLSNKEDYNKFIEEKAAKREAFEANKKLTPEESIDQIAKKALKQADEEERLARVRARRRPAEKRTYTGDLDLNVNPSTLEVTAGKTTKKKVRKRRNLNSGYKKKNNLYTPK